MRYITIAVCLSLILGCRSQKVKIISLPMMTEVDTLIHNEISSTYRTDYYLVRGKSKNIKKLIWAYTSKHLDSSLLKFSQYDMKFYKETETLNSDMLAKYSQKYKAFIGEQPIIIYSWFNGHFISH